MAGYFISNNLDVFNSTIDTLNKNCQYKTISLDSDCWYISFFQKNKIENHNNIYNDKDDFIIGVGTYFYKDYFGFDSLPVILNDFKNGKNPFKSVGGHFNFIIFLNSRLYLITDKTGHYPSYISNSHGITSYSTSFISMCHSNPELKVNKLELLEYINTSGVYGGKSIFNSINHTKSGSIYSIFNKSCDRYYDLDIKPIKLEEFLLYFKNYLKVFKKNKLNIGCDLSGGYDTRTMASGLLNCNIDFIFLSNNRDKNLSSDIKISKEIAFKTNKQLFVIDLDNHQLDDEACIDFSDGMRGLETSRRVYNEICNKSEKSEMIIGGWGAELLRNQHGKYANINDIAYSYEYSRIRLEKSISNKYISNLESKFNRTMSEINSPNFSSPGELIYFIEKGRHWSCSMLTARNKEVYTLFPFFDGLIGLKVLGLKNKSRLLQKNIIKNLYPELSNINFERKNKDLLIIRYIKKIIKTLISNEKLLYIKNITAKNNQVPTKSKKNHFLLSNLGLNYSYFQKLNDISYLERYNSLNILFKKFDGKIK